MPSDPTIPVEVVGTIDDAWLEALAELLVDLAEDQQ
jgi:hypothetical protein